MKKKYIIWPEITDCDREIRKNGEINVPPIIEEERAFIIVKSKKEGKSRVSARRITIFPRPILKKGKNFGSSISA